jgi:putative MFS transporter
MFDHCLGRSITTGKDMSDSPICVTGAEVAAEPTAFDWRTYLPAILIAGLGFLVDVYDVLLFAIVRVPSLADLGVPAGKTLEVGVSLLNAQMIGLLLGGVVWGVVGDKKGRRAALVGSILCYSLASIANSFVNSVPLYGVLRFVTGFGLAGEVGAAMTIAAEITPAKYRTFGTAAVSLMGVFGSLLASYVGGTIAWRHAFLGAGIAGLLLLCIRISMKESVLFEKAKSEGKLEKLNPFKILRDPRKILKIVRCVFIALPLFYVFGVLVTFAPEINHAGTNAAVMVAKIAAFYSIGEALGEAVCGVLSQAMRSRKKVVFLFQFCAFVLTIFTIRSNPDLYTLLCLPLGFFVGYWAVAITTTAEQFGTNVRSTVTTLVPNLMRACQMPTNLAFAAIAQAMNPMASVVILGCVSYLLAFVSLFCMEETFAKDLDFLES